MSVAQPFLKWAGGKSQLLEQYAPIFPRERIGRYFEPFLGSGAVFFFLRDKLDAEGFFLSDINSELINCFQVVRDQLDELISLLVIHKEQHERRGKAYYEEVRNRDREKSWPEASKVERAARMIYLNKTCYNGLWRVNSHGHFNVPMGHYKNPDILNEERLKAASHALQGVHLSTRSFAELTIFARTGDFVYFDPPYVPLSATSNFTNYSADSFGIREQQQLAYVFTALSARRCFVMQSNSDTELVYQLYSQFKISRVSARRAINSQAGKRGAISELVITNF